MAEEKKLPFSKVVVQLAPEHLDLIKKASTKVGARVRLVVYGSLKGFSEQQSDRSEEGANSGTLEVDASNVKYASNSEIAELFDDEFDG